MIDRPQILVEEFEHIARNQGETVRLEFLHGKLGVKAVPTGTTSRTQGAGVSGRPRPSRWRRDNCEVVVFNRPDGGVYTSTFRYAFGKTVQLPDPVGVVLETEALKTWAR